MHLFHDLSKRWEAFAERTRLRLLPPVSAAIGALLLGVLLPFVPRVDARAPELASSLASSNLLRFLRAHPDLPDTGPSGPIYSPRPAFFWPARPDASGYAFRLRRSDGTEEASADAITRTFHIVPPPGRLEPGDYRFEVLAIVNGQELPWQERSFTVRQAPEKLSRLLGTMGLVLEATESHYVLVGQYAELRSPHDVMSAFLQWKMALGEAPPPGTDSPRAWLRALDVR